ncbi:helix-turn-helix domain-containing protein [Streptomyces tanashiensis]|uniref:helix-turn-helix domain-containing protein n=1 Tax=Streptomyces tanashiensis TaxID=67367 RepID=UPI0036F14C19
MATVHEWTGLEALALRKALRLSVRGYSEHLGIAVNTISNWEKFRSKRRPNTESQAILDTALARGDAATHVRFETELAKLSEGDGSAGATTRVTIPRPRAWEYESWTDDLERAVVALSHQNFAFADDLLRRWSSSYRPSELDERGTYLLARSIALQGDLKRDQGSVVGPLSAQRCYTSARSLYTELAIPRRVAQLDLSLAVVTEMSGELEIAARQYEDLAVDERLSSRDRARARLWVGTALSKDGNHDYAVQVMETAIRELEDLAEQDDWSVAQQKLALAHRGTGNLDAALRLIDVARSTGGTESPMQRVRLDTAYGHILLSDRATLDDGLRVLDDVAQQAAQYGLTHQLRSITDIRRTADGAASPSPR